jgi:hypothetical protein
MWRGRKWSTLQMIAYCARGDWQIWRGKGIGVTGDEPGLAHPSRWPAGGPWLEYWWWWWWVWEVSGGNNPGSRRIHDVIQPVPSLDEGSEKRCAGQAKQEFPLQRPPLPGKARGAMRRPSSHDDTSLWAKIPPSPLWVIHD